MKKDDADIAASTGKEIAIILMFSLMTFVLASCFINIKVTKKFKMHLLEL
jgi:hypothetical protein